MDIVFAYTNENGGVSIVHPAPRARREGEDDAAFLARVAERSIPPGVSAVVVPLSDLPAYDSATRDRWRLVDGRVEIGPEIPKPQPVDRVAALEAKVAALVEALKAGAEGGS